MINKKYRREFQNKVYRYKQRKDRQRSGRMLTVPKLFPSFGRSGGDVTQIIVFAAIGNGFQVFAISSVSDANTGDLALLCHIYCLLFLYNGIVGKLIPGDSSPPSLTSPTIRFALEFACGIWFNVFLTRL